MTVAEFLELHDIETARQKLVRSQQSALRLLEDALHALRAGRLAVTDEFLDRAISTLKGNE